jgi:nicotinamide mononucleotide transporter
MSFLSIAALLFGCAGVILTIRQNILCWPASLVAVVLSIVEFYNERLFGDMSLQVFYFFAGIYGWIFWKRLAREGFVVTRAKTKSMVTMLVLTIIQVPVYYSLILFFNGDKPLFDAVLTAASLSATYMMTRKWVQNWFAWVLIDSAYVVLYFIKSMWAFALLYFLFAVIAFYGWLKWKRSLSR